MLTSLGTTLRDTASKYPDKPAIVHLGVSTSYEQLERISNAVANYLRGRGVVAGERIALYCINSPAFIAAYYGIVKTGAIVVPINLLLGVEEISFILDNADVSGLIYHELYGETVNKLPQLPCLRVRIGVKTDNDDTLLREIFATQETTYSPISTTSDSIATIMYTSGTTGKPKGAVLTHENLLANASATQKAMHVTPDDVFLVVLPMFHSFAATVGVHLPIISGATIAAVTRFTPDDVGRTITATKSTVFLGVPSMYTIIANLPEERRIDLSSLRLAVSGGSALPVEILHRFERVYNVPIHEGDGPTECGPVTTFNPIGRKRKPGTIGVPIPSVEMCVMDANGTALSPGTTGELCVRGPSVMRGYWKDAAATEDSFFGDWFRTGDMGFVDEDGYYTIVDRLKDMIIVNGINVYPRQIEEVIYRHPKVHEVAVVPEPDRLHGEVPRAVISLKTGETADEREIIALCREHLGRHQVPRIVDFVDELPKTASGKILKRELINKHADYERGIHEQSD